MRHRVKHRGLSRTASHYDATMTSLAQALFTEDRIVTTLAKAREVRPYAEKMITRAKTGELADRRQVLRQLKRPEVVDRLFHEIAPTYRDRNGGYTRIVKLGHRKSDAAEIALIELVDRGMQKEKTRAKSRPAARAGAGTAPPPPEGEKPPVLTEPAVPTVEPATVDDDQQARETAERKAHREKQAKPSKPSKAPKPEKPGRSRLARLLGRRGKKGQ